MTMAISMVISISNLKLIYAVRFKLCTMKKMWNQELGTSHAMSNSI
jgi:hypothetical protein